MIDPHKRRVGRHFSEEEIRRARLAGRLLAMDFQTGPVCNLDCVYCPTKSDRRPHNDLSFEETCDVIFQARDLGAQRIDVLGGGEPLMHPGILDLLAFIHEQDLAIGFFTNGVLVDPETARLLHDNDVEPVVKLNSLRAEVQDRLAGTAGAFARIRAGIENLRRAGYPDPSHELGIETIVCSSNYDEIPDLWRWARDREIVPYVETVAFLGGAAARRELNVSVDALRRLFERLAEIDRVHYGLAWDPHPPIAALICRHHEYACTLTSNGFVQPCTGIDIRVGNVRHDSLKNILAESPVIRALRHVRENVKGACADCETAERCYGCRGMAYHVTGDFLASDPLCWRNPHHVRVERGGLESENSV
ncbi:radical SAM protein [Candidatus Sumerlaeota bacterium]|nr:radical SAM protein [Candidatus Sumerlaeota bacterium]